ncbi:MAG: response regulator [Alphaproteobacteria bacterium]|jgi:CheY-like chemotaxis protein|nr:MAG: response regulator [Alphaproteobacteria bacterium]
MGMPSVRVMIVEDEPLIGAAMEMLVEDLGGQPLGPYMSLREGLAAAETETNIDCALLDCNLSREMSWPIADILAEKGVPFAFTSGKGAKDIEPRFAGRPVFTKPVDDSKLTQFILEHAPK